MKKRKAAVLAAILAVCLSAPVLGSPSPYRQEDPGAAAGYYHTESMGFLLLANGEAYFLEPEDSSHGENGTLEYDLLTDGTNLIITAPSGGEAVCLVPQQEKKAAESGGVYYALYSDFLGTAEEMEFQEGTQVQYGDYIFDNDYEVCVRDSLASFFGIDSSLDSSIEGTGFSSPEAAVSAYIRGLQNNNIHEMISAFAVETYVENYSLSRMVERLGVYLPTLGYIPTVSEMSLQLNIEQRRSEIMDSIRGHYLTLTESSLALGENGMSPVVLDDEYASPEELLDTLFVSDDSSYLSDIRFEEEFYQPALLSPSYSSEANLKSIEQQAAVINAADITSVAAKFYSGDKAYLLCVDAAEFDGKWYLLKAPGNISNLLGISSYQYGLIPLDLLEFAEISKLLE